MKRSILHRLTVLLWAAVCTLPAPHVKADPQPTPLAPGYQSLPFGAPTPGSYQLPSMGLAADGAVLDTQGQPIRLHALYGDKITLLSFIYATCDDVNGCPLAAAVFHKIQNKLRSEPEVATQLRLITLSFNPEHDTPTIMSRYGQSFQGPGVDWRFLTTRSEAEITPILADYRQSVDKEVDDQGRFTGRFSHILRVFLIDREKRIRNIYTTSFLHPDTLIADIKTLLMESQANAGLPSSERGGLKPILHAGDDKTGYESPEYRTRSVALTDRKGKPADLLKLVHIPPLGLPKVPIPADNPLTREKIDLGRKLFYDRRLSLNNTFSCAMCHIPEQGFTSQEQATAIGIEGRTVRRNAPTIYNVAYLEKLFHDGRESSLENQVWGPFLAANEMGNPSVGSVVNKIKMLPDYRGMFEKSFRRGPSMETVGQAIASYERTLISGNSPFDRWRYGDGKNALTSQARLGFELFTGKAGCSGCHTIGEKTALFTDNQMHNTGLGYRASMQKTSTKQRVQLAPGIAVDMDSEAIGLVGEAKPNDLGLYEVTQNPADRWKYKTPSLRNVALTAPYMHNGGLPSLRDVVQFYNHGGEPNENLTPLIKPLGLSDAEVDALVEFLNALTGDNIESLVSDAYAAPVGDAH